VILLRGAYSSRAEGQVALILNGLPTVGAALQRGAIVILERHRIRLRELPIRHHRHGST
jgi:hypothetical protein